MAKDDLAAAVRPDDEIARRVHRYERALLAVLHQRREEERTAPITNGEHLLAAQVAEAVTAYERGLRKTPLPEAKETTGPAGEEPPRTRKAPQAARRSPVRRRGRGRRKAPAEPAAAPQEG